MSNGASPSTGVRACGLCKARFDEEPDLFQISAHLNACSTSDRALAALRSESSQSLAIGALLRVTDSVNCPALLIVLRVAVEAILMTESADVPSAAGCPVVPARRLGRSSRPQPLLDHAATALNSR